jgi:hypothetical protein
MWAFLSALLPDIFKVIDKSIPDKDKAAEIKMNIQSQLLENEGKSLQAARDIIVAEAEGHSWMQRNWRPSLMFLFGAIIANNYILYPYATLFTEQAVLLPVPQDLWDLIKIGLGGYVLGRSGEKIATSLSKKDA